MSQYRHRSRSKQKDKPRDRSRSPYRQPYHRQSRERDRESRERDRESRQRDHWEKEYSSSYRQHRQNKEKQYKASKQHKKYQQPQSQQQTKALCIQSISPQYIKQLQQIMTDTSISVGTSMPDEVQLRQNVAIIKYPSPQVSASIYQFLKGAIHLGGKEWKLRYWPIKKSDINISYDWYCDKCDYKNFARRGRCHRCDNERNPNCRLNYGSQFVTFNNPSTKKQQIEDSANCSLMIRGTIITQIQQQLLLNLFESFAPIKDIRMIRNKITGGNKDFAFVEFFSPEEAAFALKKATAPNFKVAGQKVTVMYSRTKQDDQFYARPYDKDRRGPPPPRKQTKQSQQIPNYYLRQRQLEIQQQKKRPLITLQQLKEKRENELKKNLPQQKQMTEQQNQRRKAQILAKQWQKEMKQQISIIYICPLCKRKFKNDEQLSNHAKFSQIHKYRMAKMEKQLLLL